MEVLSEAAVVPLANMEDVIEPEETLAADVVATDEVADASVDWVAELNKELVELEKAIEEVELDTTAEVVLPKLLDEAVLLADVAEDPVVVELLGRDSTMAKSVPGAATLLFLSTLL